ncbi:IS110 family transposase [Ornithinimicrobium faecis]|uniref:IS110 family transposase n=1 Tax=Ornithinimicrobium faecis TaxID=2934158 RepID=UPI00211875AE|nr:IS110 family transposase [Ornithinimicrobium sp. HY1745]
MTLQLDRASTIEVIGGADTHAETVHVAAVNQLGVPLGDAEFPTTAAGYQQALEFLATFEVPVATVGIEGTASYGAGLAAACAQAGLEVLEVNRPDRSARRARGKSDPIDAYQAGLAVLSGRATAAPKSQDLHGLAAVQVARRSAVKAATAVSNQIRDLLVTAPASLRDKYRDLAGQALMAALARCRPDQGPAGHRLTLVALKSLARRHQDLSAEGAELLIELGAEARRLNPYLLSLTGVGPENGAKLLITAGANPARLRSEASFAALCGTAPVQASSGKVTRHRYSRGGDRQANSALHNIGITRAGCQERTREYLAAQRATRKHTGAGVMRKLKRAIAREIYQALTNPQPVPEVEDLRPLRKAKKITLQQAAEALGTYPTKISRTEKNTHPDYDLATRYRTWLTAA